MIKDSTRHLRDYMFSEYHCFISAFWLLHNTAADDESQTSSITRLPSGIACHRSNCDDRHAEEDDRGRVRVSSCHCGLRRLRQASGGWHNRRLSFSRVRCSSRLILSADDPQTLCSTLGAVPCAKQFIMPLFNPVGGLSSELKLKSEG